MLASFRGNFASHRVSDLKLALVTLASAVALRCCILSIVLGAAASLSADDGSPEASPPSRRSSLFRLPSFLKRDRETKATAKPAPPNPYLVRATEMLVQARTFESNGNPAAALEMARRAESIIKATSQTTETRWPRDSQSPSQYIADLSQRIRVAGIPLGSVADPPTSTDTLPFVADPQSRTQSTPPIAEAQGATAPRLPTEPAAQSARLSNSNSQEQKPTNAPVHANRALQSGSANPVLNKGNSSPTPTIKLTGASQPDQPSSAADIETDETSLLFQQLGKLETWSAIEPTDEKNSEVQNRDVDNQKPNELSTQPSPPMVVPALIDRPDEIDDQNVAPIPTRPTDSIEGSAPKSVTTTIPVVPESMEQTPPMQIRQNGSRNDDHQTLIAAEDDDPQSNIYDTTPQLLTQPNDATLAATAKSTDNSASVWQIAAAQLVATFLGVLLAIGLFLVIRAAAVKLFGTRLGVTFHFGSNSSTSTESKSKNESVDTVPFGVQSPHDSTTTAVPQPEETGRAGDAADPTDFPFRVVGSSKSDHDSSAEGNLNQQQEAAILRTVFDQNLDLMSELDKQNGSAA